MTTQRLFTFRLEKQTATRLFFERQAERGEGALDDRDVDFDGLMLGEETL